VDHQNGFKKSQKSFFTTNEDFTHSNSRISKLMNQIQFPGSDFEDEANDHVRIENHIQFDESKDLKDKTLGKGNS